MDEAPDETKDAVFECALTEFLTAGIAADVRPLVQKFQTTPAAFAEVFARLPPSMKKELGAGWLPAGDAARVVHDSQHTVRWQEKNGAGLTCSGCGGGRGGRRGRWHPSGAATATEARPDRMGEVCSRLHPPPRVPAGRGAGVRRRSERSRARRHLPASAHAASTKRASCTALTCLPAASSYQPSAT